MPFIDERYVEQAAELRRKIRWSVAAISEAADHDLTPDILERLYRAAEDLKRDTYHLMDLL